MKILWENKAEGLYLQKKQEMNIKRMTLAVVITILGLSCPTC